MHQVEEEASLPVQHLADAEAENLWRIVLQEHPDIAEVATLFAC